MKNTESGISVLEMIVTLTVLATLLSIATFNLKELFNPSKSGAEQFTTHFKLVRSLAMSSTLAYRIAPSGTNGVSVQYAKTCNADSNSWETDTKLNLELPKGAVFNDQNWFVCVDARGLADANLVVDISDVQSGASSIEIFLGGGTKIA